MTRCFENALLLILSAVIAGGLVATGVQHARAHPEMLVRAYDYEMMIPF